MDISGFSIRFFNTPWMILPEKLNAILSAFQAIGNRSDFVIPENKREGISLAGPSNVSIIPVHGPLTYRSQGGLFEFLFGAMTTYDEIRTDFYAALDDDSDAILFDINSPGGQASGLMDLVDEIYGARGKKPIYAISNEHAYSAAYAIASAADKVFLSRTAGIGSVGVIAIHTDQSKYDEDLGVKYTHVFAGDRKIDLDRHRPLSNEAKRLLQEDVNDHYELFVKTVARNRGLKLAEVRSTEAGLFTGEKAVKIGFADEVMPYSLSVQNISKGFSSSNTKATAFGSEELEITVQNLNALGDQTETLKTKEVKEMNIEELTEKHPDLLAEITKSVTDELTAGFDQEKKDLEKTLTDKFSREREGLVGKVQGLEDRVLVFEKSEAIRTVKELKLEAQVIWTYQLSQSDVSEGLYDKVINQVSHEKFVKDGVLDVETFTEAVKAEIEDWEGRGATSTVLGTGVSVKDTESSESAQLKREDDADSKLADDIFAAAGGDREKGGE